MLMDNAFAAYAWQNDQRIARLTGQPFSERYRSGVLGSGGLFDSAPATLGLVAVALNAPGQELAALKTLQHARYVDGRDITSLAAVAAILSGMGLQDAAARVAAPDAGLLTAYRNRTQSARAESTRFDAQGVPALIVGNAAARRLLRAGTLPGDFNTLINELQAA
ncbi:DsbA family protein [Insolitispirillum peregrinum]